MKVCLSLICFFFLTALQDGDAEKTHTEKEEANITVGCLFNFFGSTKFFCKENCEGENILIETEENRAQRGRYSVTYERKGFTSSVILYVSITELKVSDSGRYRCSLDYPNLRYEDFTLTVTKASTTSVPKWTLQTFTSTFPSSASVTTATSTQRLISSSSSSFETIQNTTSSSTGPKAANRMLYVGLVLVILIILLAAALLIFCKRKRFSRQKGPRMKTPHLDFTIDNTVYEEIREEDRENKPSPGEISSVYTYVKSSKTIGADSNEVYSLASHPQSNREEDKVGYSEVGLSKDATLFNNDPCELVNNIIYSEPQIATSSADISNCSPSLYSSVILQE